MVLPKDLLGASGGGGRAHRGQERIAVRLPVAMLAGLLSRPGLVVRGGCGTRRAR